MSDESRLILELNGLPIDDRMTVLDEVIARLPHDQRRELREELCPPESTAAGDHENADLERRLEAETAGAALVRQQSALAIEDLERRLEMARGALGDMFDLATMLDDDDPYYGAQRKAESRLAEAEKVIAQIAAPLAPVEGTWEWARFQMGTEREGSSKGRVVEIPGITPHRGIAVNDDGVIVYEEGGRPAIFSAEDFDATNWRVAQDAPEQP